MPSGFPHFEIPPNGGAPLFYEEGFFWGGGGGEGLGGGVNT